MASITVIFQLAIATLLENKLRSILTLIGIVFGNAAVIATLSSNEGARVYISKQLEKLGTKIMVVNSSIELKKEHLKIIKTYSSDIESIVRLNDLGGAYARADRKLVQTKILAVDSEYFLVNGYHAKLGRVWGEEEYEEVSLVAVLGSKLYEQLFAKKTLGLQSQLSVQIGEASFQLLIIGVLNEKGGAYEAHDNSIFISTSLGQKFTKQYQESQTLVLLKDDQKSTSVKNQILGLLQPKYKDMLQISDAREAIERTKSIWDKQNFVGICLALISLLTGGVGIMNIMLLSVNQRKKEIGLRKAIGAKDYEIAVQFLIESVIICFVGGVLGVLMGLGFGQQVARMLGEWQAQTSWLTVVLALGFSILTGVLFGMIPALRASQVDPYDALRGV